MSKTYFKGLDALLGIAAIAVVFGHIELIMKSFNFKKVYDGKSLIGNLLYLLSLIFTIIISGISNYFIDKPILKYKK
jgi:peptidoglycan/LPS O-acetylase OafA/YrhL